MALSIRARLTLWYTAVLLAVLTLFGTGVYVVLSRRQIDDLDAELRRAGAAVAAGVEAEMQEEASLAEAAQEAHKDFALPGRPLAIHDASGALLAGTPIRGFELGPGASEGAGTVTSGGEEWRLVVVRRSRGSQAYAVVTAEPLARLSAARAVLRRTLVVGIPLGLGLAAAGGLWIARRALAPVSLMVGQASQVTRHTPGFRLRVPDTADELGVLARSFNALLERVDGALSTQRDRKSVV